MKESDKKDKASNIKIILEWVQKHIIFCIIFIVIFPFIILTPSCIGFLNKSDAQTLVGYFGTIVGGLLTLVGVCWTLNNQQKQFDKNLEEQKLLSKNELDESRHQFEIQLSKKDEELNNMKMQRYEDLAIRYKPFLKIYTSDDNLKIITKDNIKYLNMTIKNIGRGEALDCKMYDKKGKPFYSPNCLPAGIESDLPIAMPNENNFCKSITLYMEYKDLFKKNTYKLSLIINLEYKNSKIINIETIIEYL